MDTKGGEKMSKQFRVRIGGWSNSRLVVLEKEQVTMEVARINCSHCATCSARMHYVNARLRGDEKMSYQGGGVLVTLPYPKGRAKNQLRVTEYIGERLGLQVSILG